MHSHQTDRKDDAIVRILLPSILCILLCMVLLCGMTWAWFQSTQSAPTVPIQSAEYSIAVTVSGEAENGTQNFAVENGACTLPAGIYTVTLTASGTASTGYCIVTLPTDGERYTRQLAPGESLSFSLSLTDGGTVTFSPQWGTSSRFEHPDYE